MSHRLGLGGGGQGVLVFLQVELEIEDIVEALRVLAFSDLAGFFVGVQREDEHALRVELLGFGDGCDIFWIGFVGRRVRLGLGGGSKGKQAEGEAKRSKGTHTITPAQPMWGEIYDRRGMVELQEEF